MCMRRMTSHAAPALLRMPQEGHWRRHWDSRHLHSPVVAVHPWTFLRAALGAPR